MSMSTKTPEELAHYRTARGQVLDDQRAERDDAREAYRKAAAATVSNTSKLREKRLAAEDVIILPTPAKPVVKRLKPGQTRGTRRAIHG